MQTKLKKGVPPSATVSVPPKCFSKLIDDLNMSTAPIMVAGMEKLECCELVIVNVLAPINMGQLKSDEEVQECLLRPPTPFAYEPGHESPVNFKNSAQCAEACIQAGVDDPNNTITLDLEVANINNGLKIPSEGKSSPEQTSPHLEQIEDHNLQSFKPALQGNSILQTVPEPELPWLVTYVAHKSVQTEVVPELLDLP